MVHRRQWLGGSAAALVGFSAGSSLNAEEKVITKGRIKQSVAAWCFTSNGDKWDVETLCQHVKHLGGVSVELIDSKHWGTLKKHGLICAMASNTMPGSFRTGFNNTVYHEELIDRTKKVIDQCAEAGFPNVIAFTGYKYRKPDDPKSGEISKEEGLQNCVKGLKQILGHAEKKKVNICMEHLNTRDDSHPMKGHPGYQGDDLDYVANIIRQVGSKRMKLLFDIYHVQIMHGDVIRRLEQTKDILGHIHTAGNPGRAELDANQEINYPPILRKLLDLKFTGYVGQEFIPTRNALEGLKQAMQLCDV